MPWIPSDEILDDGELLALATLPAELGVSQLRITGGEPLVRPGLAGLIARLRALPGIEEIALTTNAVLLEGAIRDAVHAKEAGHGMDEPGYRYEGRPMSMIGG